MNVSEKRLQAIARRRLLGHPSYKIARTYGYSYAVLNDIYGDEQYKAIEAAVEDQMATEIEGRKRALTLQALDGLELLLKSDNLLYVTAGINYVIRLTGQGENENGRYRQRPNSKRALAMLKQTNGEVKQWMHQLKATP